MNKKILAAVIAAVMTVPAMAAASQFTATPRDGNILYDEQIVEGHTVFTVIEKVNEDKRQGWDVAGLVREVNRDVGPNVAWFNDQWKTFFGVENVRYPCGGYVLATWAGVDPLHLLKAATITANAADITYQESYYITDPNGFVSETHLYYVASAFGLTVIPIWITEVQGINSVGDDDGVSTCLPQEDLATHDTTRYHDGGDNVPTRIYNFDVFGLWQDVLPSGAKQHGNGSTSDTTGEVTGCAAGTEWECPAPGAGLLPPEVGNLPLLDTLGDDMEGNSHPYNPQFGYSGELHTHETALIDLVFVSTLDRIGVLRDPATTNYIGYPPAAPNYEVFDDEATESEVHPCNVAGYVNVDIASQCF